MLGAFRTTCRRRQLSSALSLTSGHHHIAQSTGLAWLCLESARRHYASKGKGGKQKQKGDGDEDAPPLIPGSQQFLTGDAMRDYEAAEAKMKTAVDWFRREVAGMEARLGGRVAPDVLNPVRVALPDAEGAPPAKLAEVATIGVQEGTTLVVTVFEERNLKYVEKAIIAAKIPHVVPQRGSDNRTLKIHMPKPTVDARAVLVKTAAKQAEDVRVQVRRHGQTAVKKGSYQTRGYTAEKFQELVQKQVGAVDEMLTGMKKKLGVK